MYVHHVRTLNFMAFAGEQNVGPLPVGPIAVVGRYEENARRSNWSGKTAWLESIRFALTGAHRKRIDDALITYGADRMEVEVTFSTGVHVLRLRPRGGPTVLRVWQDRGESAGLVYEREAAEAQLASLLRLPVEDFDNTSWFGQGDIQALCAKTSGVRREVFARWLELDMWERAGAAAQQNARNARALLDGQRAASVGAEPRVDGDIASDIAINEQTLEAAERARAAVNAKLEAFGIFGALATRRAEVESVAKSLASVREQLGTIPQFDDEAVAAASEELQREHVAEGVAEKAIGETRQLIGGRFDGRCPVTCEACPVADEVAGKREAFVERNRLAVLERDRARKIVGSSSDLVNAHAKAQRDRQILVARMNDLTARSRTARAALAEVERQIAEAGFSNDAGAIDTLRAERSAIDVELRELNQKLGALRTEREHAASYLKRVREREESIALAERKARVAQLVARALGGSGIPAKIAAVSLSGLEARANELLAGQGLSFTLTWERELADPAPACAECGHVYDKRGRARSCPSCGAERSRKKSDELDVLVDDGSGEVEDVRAKSGGAKVLVASAIRLAGGMMLRERRGSPLEVAFVDEPFGELDLENRDALARTFAGLLSSVGLEQAFVVSHDAQLLGNLPARVLVTRDGSISRLTLEA